MAKNQQALSRYKVILKVLRRSGKHSSKEIFHACVNSGIDVKYRTIQNDLTRLKDDPTVFSRDLGIEFDPSTKKWYSNGIPKEIFTLLELEDGEVTSLLFYAKAINQYRDYPLFEGVMVAIEKVIESSNISDNLKQLFNSDGSLETEKHEPVKGIELIPDVLEAIQKSRLMFVEYGKFNGELKTFEIKPLLLKEDKQLWYVVGIDASRNSLITLALDRIISNEITETVFEKQVFSSKDYFQYSFGITVSDVEPEIVVLSFSPYQGNYLKTLPIHHTQEVIIDNEKEFRVKLTVIPSYEFYSKIRSYGDQVIVLEPSSIANEVQKSFANALKAYQKK
jgi:predicted DNA-binding transcriptional regulator YafY